MQSGIKIRLFKAGFCTHPGFMVEPGTGLKPKKFPAGVAVILHPKQGYVLFDTGYHPSFYKSTRSFPERFYAMATQCHLHNGEKILEQLEVLNIKSSDIKHLLLSHFHADHIAGMIDFPESLIHCHKAGLDYMEKSNRINRVRKGYLKNLVPKQAYDHFSFIESFTIDVSDILELRQPLSLYAVDLFDDQSIYVVNLPGHAAGHIGLLVRLSESFVFLLADACWLQESLEQHVNQHWLANMLSDDHSAYKDTLQKLRKCFNLCVGKSVVFVPSHCEKTIDRLIHQNWMT